MVQEIDGLQILSVRGHLPFGANKRHHFIEGHIGVAAASKGLAKDRLRPKGMVLIPARYSDTGVDMRIIRKQFYAFIRDADLVCGNIAEHHKQHFGLGHVI